MSDAREATRARLARLLRTARAPDPRGARETVAPPEPAGAASGPVPDLAVPAPAAAEDRALADLRAQLLRRAARARAPDAPDAPCADVTKMDVTRVHGPRTLALEPPARLAPTALGALARTTEFPLAHRHGARALADALGGDPSALAAAARDPRVAEVDFSRAVFLDTETTGLSGGAGTYVFLVGLLSFENGSARVWQGFLDHPARERALLEECAERVRAASAIVSFFGKSFDRHRLEDKMRLHALAPPFADAVHLDLYWPLRRLVRGVGGVRGVRAVHGTGAAPERRDCRLRTLENELAGVERGDDLPGSFAPAAWFDFQAGRPHRLEGVFQHNLDDVLSLASLLACLGDLASEARDAAARDRA